MNKSDYKWWRRRRLWDCRYERRNGLTHYLKESQRWLADYRKSYYRRKRIMNTIRNIFIIFILAIAITVLQSGCALATMAAVAMSRDPIDTDGQREACEGQVSEQEEHYSKSRSKVEHTSKVVCK